MTWFSSQNDNVKLNIFVKPNAKKTAILAIINHELHIALHAKPHQGEANETLMSYLAKRFKLPKKKVILHSGRTSRHKQVIVPLTPSIAELLVNPSAFFSS